MNDTAQSCGKQSRLEEHVKKIFTAEDAEDAEESYDKRTEKTERKKSRASLDASLEIIAMLESVVFHHAV